MERHLRRGIILILVSGILVVTTLTALLLLQLVLSSRALQRTTTGRRQAEIAAASGLDYAAARLWESPFTPADDGAPLTKENRPDDWTRRQGPENPSWARGDGWKDADGNGAWTAGIDAPDPASDLEANGRFDAWSGRLRGGAAPYALRFALAVRAAAAGISVNGGELNSPVGDHDLDGVLNGTDPDYLSNVPAAAHRDPAWPGNVHLVNLLDNLGAVLGLSDTSPRPFAPGYPALGTIAQSGLGTLVITHRPPGGYVSIDQLKPHLPPDDYGKVAPHLCVSAAAVPVALPVPNDKMNAFWRKVAYPEERYEFHVPVDFNRCDVAVLQACLRNIAAAGHYGSAGTIPYVLYAPYVRLGEGEADAVAQKLAENRPIRTWRRFLEVLHAQGAPLFTDDLFTQGTDESLPVNHPLKEDLILAQAMPGGFLGDPASWRQNALEVPRENPASLFGTDDTSTRRILKEFLAPHLSSAPYDQTGTPILTLDAAALTTTARIPCRMTTELDLAAIPDAFAVDAEGQASPGDGQASAIRQAAAGLSFGRGAIRLSSQQDFEMFSTPWRPVAPATPWHLPGGEARAEGPCQAKNGVQTTPRFPLDSYEVQGGLWTGLPPAAGWMIANDGYPRVDGALTLQNRPMTNEELGVDIGNGTNRCVFSLPWNADRVGEILTRYDPVAFRDNIEDPILSPATGAPRSPPSGALLFGIARHLHEGYRGGPNGPRFWLDSIVMDDLVYRWEAPSDPTGWPFPLPRGNNPSAGSGELRNATIAGWFCAPGGERIGGDGNITALFHLEYRWSGASSATYFQVIARKDGSVDIHTPYNGGTTTLTPAWTGDPVLARSPWHHLALVFDGGGADDQMTDIRAYIDGMPTVPPVVPLGFSAGYIPAGPEMTLRIGGAPYDDLRFFDTALTQIQIVRFMLAPPFGDRYTLAGTWTSPRFHFDAARLPDGVRPWGVSWDAFLPENTRGTVAITLTGYDAGGAAIGSRSAPPWNGTSPPIARLYPGPSRAVDVRIDLAATHAATTLVPIHRDTPVVESVTVHYAGRPRWTPIR